MLTHGKKRICALSGSKISAHTYLQIFFVAGMTNDFEDICSYLDDYFSYTENVTSVEVARHHPFAGPIA